MVELTDVKRAEIASDLESFENDCHNFPENERTDRGEPFWYRSPARQLLAEDVKSGLAHNLKPAALREKNEEYKEFPLLTFRKHIYQEQEKQRAAPFWRTKRNIAAQYQIEKVQEEMRCEEMAERTLSDFAKDLKKLHL